MVLYKLSGTFVLVTASETYMSQDLRGILDGMDMTCFGWDEGSEEYLTPKNLFITCPLSSYELNYIIGLVGDRWNEEVHPWYGCWNEILLTSKPEDTEVDETRGMLITDCPWCFKTIPKTAFAAICKKQDEISALLGQPTLKYTS